MFARIWRNPDFRALSPVDRNVALDPLMGPQTNRIGLFYLSPDLVADDLTLTSTTCATGRATLQSEYKA